MITVHCPHCGSSRAAHEHQRYELVLAHDAGGVYVNDTFVRFTRMQMRMLQMLVDCKPNIVKHSAMQDHVYGEHKPKAAAGSLQVQVYKINEKLLPVKWQIANKKGVGNVLKRKI